MWVHLLEYRFLHQDVTSTGCGAGNKSEWVPSQPAAGNPKRLLTQNKKKSYTPSKLNIAPENGWLEDEFPFGMACF